MSQNATLDFLCGECKEHTSLAQDVQVGNNTADFTCSSCGEQWHVRLEITSLAPFQAELIDIKRMIGVLKNGQFFAKGSMH